MSTVPRQTLHVAICHDHDGEGPARKREEQAGAHFAHIESVLERIAVAGPLRDEDGRTIGSLIVFRCDSAAEARALLDRDPYAKAGIWKSVEIRPFLAAAGDWIGGKIW